MAALSAAVVGPGGVGGLLGGLLVRAGARVEFVAGERTAEALRAGGLSVRSVKYGDFTVPVAATTELSGPVDVCFVTTKATSLEAALERAHALADRVDFAGAQRRRDLGFRLGLHSGEPGLRPAAAPR